VPGVAARGVVFLDRDGTINVKARDGEYIVSPDDVVLLPAAASGVRALNESGWPVVVVSNQRGIALGRITEAGLRAVNLRLRELLAQAGGARIDAMFHCPHDYGQCDCRKPAPGLFLAAQRAFPWIALSRSWMIGDAPSDVAAATAVGVRALLLGVDASDLSGAAQIVLGEQRH
jgi:D-glycero-D-manno-heptose 1,7-bisphosphate phosphatase